MIMNRNLKAAHVQTSCRHSKVCKKSDRQTRWVALKLTTCHLASACTSASSSACATASACASAITKALPLASKCFYFPISQIWSLYLLTIFVCISACIASCQLDAFMCVSPWTSVNETSWYLTNLCLCLSTSRRTCLLSLWVCSYGTPGAAF